MENTQTTSTLERLTTGYSRTKTNSNYAKKKQISHFPEKDMRNERKLKSIIESTRRKKGLTKPYQICISKRKKFLIPFNGSESLGKSTSGGLTKSTSEQSLQSTDGVICMLIFRKFQNLESMAQSLFNLKGKREAT